MNEQNAKKHRIENNQDGIGKNKSSTNIYIMKKHNRIKITSHGGYKISLEENRGSFKEHKEKIKTWMRNLTGKTDKKPTKTGKKDKTK